VLKAGNKQSDREFTTVLHVEQTRTGSRLVATDGVRMHVAEIGTKIKSGNYKPVVTKDAIRLGDPVGDIEFPSWAKVVPAKASKRGVINLETTGVGKARSTSMAMTRAYNSFVRQSGEKVNPHFLEDLPKKQWVIYCQNEKRKPLVLKEDGAAMETYAVIMPLAA
jgi:DNA polymerase III sliding clamp (beta) subunit (PCNA family)